MPEIGQPYTCGHWTVRDGSEEEFIIRWTELVDSAKAHPGSGSFVLIQDQHDPHKFISFGSWDKMDTANAWRTSPEFGQNMGACRELCDDFSPADSTLRAALGT